MLNGSFAKNDAAG